MERTLHEYKNNLLFYLDSHLSQNLGLVNSPSLTDLHKSACTDLIAIYQNILQLPEDQLPAVPIFWSVFLHWYYYISV